MLTFTDQDLSQKLYKPVSMPAPWVVETNANALTQWADHPWAWGKGKTAFNPTIDFHSHSVVNNWSQTET